MAKPNYNNGGKMKKLLILVLVLGLVPLAFQGQDVTPEMQDTHGKSAEAEVAKLEAFIDGIMYAHMKANHIAGATFSMVKDGEIIFKKGYGYADIEKKKPVSPDTTMFRPGSVSKLFTWTAVMQLYEQGKLDLDADVNTYLEAFKIPDTYPEPITMKHLLTHTPGFEEVGGIWAHKVEDMVTLEEQLKVKLPKRVFPPGSVTAYSNYGTALAGYIVEILSGMSFEEYVEKNIYEPLGMNFSTFRQPLPTHLEEHMSNGYSYKNGVYEVEEFELVNGIGPAGCMSASAVDMAKFAIAHLQEGQYKDRRILEKETAELMHSRLHSHHPKLWGNAHGFWEHDMNNLRIIEHGGDTIWFHSFFVLLPEQNTGFFLSYNSAGGGGESRGHLLQALLDRFHPVPPVAKITPPADFKDRAAKYTGTYTMARSIQSKYTKLMRLLMVINIEATDEGTLLAKAPMGMGSYQLVEVEPGLFREIEGPGLFAFREDENGRVTHGFIGMMPHSALEKLAWYESPPFSYFLLALTIVLFLTALRWPLRAIFSKICKTPKQEKPGSKTARWVAGIMSLLYILFLIAFLATHANAMQQMIYGYPSGIKTVLILPLIALVFLIASIIFTFLAWVKKYWSGCARVHYTLIVLAGIGFAWFLNLWNLIGFKL